MERNISGGNLAPKVHTEDDGLMVNNGLRNPHLEIDRSVFKKDTFEKKSLKAVKDRLTPKKIVVRANGVKYFGGTGTLVVYIRNDKKLKDFKTTRSYRNVKGHEVDGIIFRLSERKLRISKYYFNI